MKKEKTNELYLLHIGDRKMYFTNSSRVGAKLGVAATSVIYAEKAKSKFVTKTNEVGWIEKVDGSEIPWKDIDNV